MSEFTRLLAYGAGALCLGAALTLGLLVAAASRYSEDRFEGCLGIVLCLIPLGLAMYFFLRAVGP